ncbi:MAG: hypothetical protein PUK70_01705 [Bacteroidales bacterium]|nr:hypothetical protein [Bacteroidales bacterium]MDY6002650.1 hypothetical protein [Candidatus Cryptobacteroides sp.]
MPSRKKVNIVRTEAASVQFQNKHAQLVSLVSACQTFVVMGRGGAKTTDIQAERLFDLVYELPGAPVVWVADTFSNLSANILPSVIEGLERKGFRDGIHYVIEKEPPAFNDAETASLPAWLKPHFWKPFNKLVSYKRTMVFFTGLNVRFGSLDRPSTLAGASYVYVFGDEVKYFPEEKISNLMKALRGYRQEYGHSPFYRGCSFTTDMPDTTHVGEYDWILKYAKNMDSQALLIVMRAGLVYNQALQECVAAKDVYMKSGSEADLKTYENKMRIASLWKARWTELRMRPEARTFFLLASSYVNSDILTEQWFADAIAAKLPDLNTAIMSMRPTLESGDRFYASLAEKHFYFDGIDESAYEDMRMSEGEDCRVLRYLNPDAPLMAGVDFGNMCSMSVAQNDTEGRRACIRVIKFLFTLAPEYVQDLGSKFKKYFSWHKSKILMLYYDRAGNAYKSVGEDQVGKLKRAIEYDDGTRSGWTVQLMSIGQGNITQSEEYAFMQELLAETNYRMPVIRIDAYAARELKLSLENARTKVKNGVVGKDKSSEKLPVNELPTKSTNPSDSFKYLLMTKKLRQLAQGRRGASSDNLDPIFFKDNR